jgi:hypothetical protein
MATNISFQQALTANQIIAAQTDVVNSEFNPSPSNARIRLFAAATVAGTGGKGALLTLTLGSEVKGRDIMPPVSANLSLRDHLVFEGIILRGTKYNLGVRNEGTATPTVNGMIVLEPL